MPQLTADDMRTRTAEAIDAMSGELKIVVFGCEHGFNVNRLDSHEIKGVRLICSGMMPPTLVEYAQRQGADGVFTTGCRSGDCYYRLGNAWMDQRFEGQRKPVLRQRAKRHRITVYRAAETDTAKLRRRIAEFQHEITAMKQEESAGQNREAGNA